MSKTITKTPNKTEPKRIGPASRKQAMIVNSTADITLAGGAAGCVDADTEYLSPNGWIRIADYDGGLVAQLDPYTHQVQFVKPSEYIKIECNKLTRFSNEYTDQVLSDEHKIPYYDKETREQKIIHAGFLERKVTQGWKADVKVTFTLGSEEGDCLYEITQEQAQNVVNYLSKDNSDSIWYSSKDKQHIDYVQFCLHACGYKTSITKAEEYLLVGIKSEGFVELNSNLDIEEYETKDGFKYCFEVPSKFLLLRRNNKLVVTNNSGKTFVLLITALRFMQHPRATGVIFRRNSTMLTAPGSVWQEAVGLFQEIYPKGLKITQQPMRITLPQGATLQFSHLQFEKDRFDWKGSQLSFCAFDEASEFTEEQVTYLITRMRNANVDYKPQMFLTTNPDYESFLRLWIQDYYLDHTGLPIQERAGHVRYFFKQGVKYIWYNSLEEAQAVHGSGDDAGIMSFTFIPANCYDNPVLLKADPSYPTRLKNQPRVEMERLLLGNWFARQEASGYWKREWCKMVFSPNLAATKRVRAWDIAMTEPSEAYPNPDWTRGVLISKQVKEGIYTVEDLKSCRKRAHDVESLIFRTAEQDGQDVVISIPLDPGASAQSYSRDLAKRLMEKGFIVRLMKPQKSKITRFAPFTALSQAGFVQIKADMEWNGEFFEELENFDGSKSKKDDIVDTCSDAIAILNKDLGIPDIDVGSFDLSIEQPNVALNTGATGSVGSFSIPSFKVFNSNG